VQDLREKKENCPHMARLSGVDLPRDKRLEVALTYIYGIGRTRALQTLDATGVSGDTRVSSLSDEELIRLRDWIDASYQRTQTNARTRKGKKKTVAGRKKTGKK
jgi:small subunit ribosomal protein S13